MSKLLILWEMEASKMPTDPNEQAALLGKEMEMTKQALERGDITDWGLYAGGSKGYALSEGTAIDAFKASMNFSPYVKFEVHPVLSLGEVAEAMKAMMG